MNITLRIELPAYSHSFNVLVSESSTVHSVKQEISQMCPGQPRVEGQRLIWRGRNLTDEERVDDLWKSPTDTHILHLAVHPSAWVGLPPEIPNSRLISGELAAPMESQVISNPFFPTANPIFPLGHSLSSASPYIPIPYIALKHQNAIEALMTSKPPHSENASDLRHAAKAAIERIGWSWPTVLDERYPVAETGGLRYQPTVINGQHYLSLVNDDLPPTLVQKHALSILSYTFSLLDLSVASSTITQTHASYSTASPVPPQVNQILRQLGLPPLRVVQNPNQNQNAIIPQLREMQLRPLLMPLMLLVFRTLLLLYFVAPARKPILGILILAWMLYEIWQPIRHGLRIRVQHINRPDHDANPQAMNNNPQGEPVPGANAQWPIGYIGARQLDAQASIFFDVLANMNLQAEEAVVNQSHIVPVAEPSLGQKTLSFFGLLLSTLHPAFWNRRRAALRRREGVIRAEANMRREPGSRNPDEEETDDDRRATQTRHNLREQHAHRPQWVQRYMDRVVAEEWVDDSD